MSSTTQKGHNQFGNLPVWDLSDLYPGKDSPEFKAAVEEAKGLAAKFEADYKGKLVELTKAGSMISNATFRPFAVFGCVALMYFALCFPVSMLARHLERRTHGRRA